MSNPSIPVPQKCLIKNLDESGKDVEAYFNPKEFSVDKAVKWNVHKDTQADAPILEFTDGEAKSFQVELLFDGYEAEEDVHKKYVEKLLELTKIIKEKKRPPMCIFLWGKAPSFLGVIESLSTKYTMFLPNGTPVRATVTVKMKQADKLAVANKEGGDSKKPPDASKSYAADGDFATEADAKRADKFGDDHRAALDASGTQTYSFEPGTRVPKKKKTKI